VQVRAFVAEERTSPKRAGSDTGSPGQLAQRTRPAGRNDQGVARILAGGHGHEHQSFGRPGRNVLERMHSEIRAAIQHRAVDFLREETRVTDLREWHVRDAVARGGDDFDVDAHLGVCVAQQRLNVPGLPERERTAAGREALHVPPPCIAWRGSGALGREESTVRANAGLSSGGARNVVKITMIRMALYTAGVRMPLVIPMWAKMRPTSPR